MHEMNAAGHWQGALSSSALATAVAVAALARQDAAGHRRLIDAGVQWLAQHANADGGWGDTPDSISNLSTTLLCWSALACAGQDDAALRAAADRAEAWLAGHADSVSPQALARAVLSHYGSDRTFSAPILTLAALAGRLGPADGAWQLVPQLPFELALFPPRLFKWLGLPVVSYALPALIAIGQVRHRLAPTRNPLRRAIRNLAARRTLGLLQRMQPANGGFLEATPLTGFVVLSLAACGHAGHPVAVRGAEFLRAAMRADGSWPIDTNLATWVTTLAVQALSVQTAADSDFAKAWPECAEKISAWLLAQQHLIEHPFTHAAPGGWAWTDLPGGVPDADDTAGALLALRHLGPADTRIRAAAAAGVAWLLELQNRDGGVPTFCKGWSALPFDTSCPDLTAHALRAFHAWRDELPASVQTRIDHAVPRALRYLAGAQRADGSWLPLWFGNQHAARHENPTYGTAQVVTALQDLPAPAGSAIAGMIASGCQWLAAAQQADGGWGGALGAPASIEETALATAALARGDAACRAAATRGAAWLLARTRTCQEFPAAPIGLYFASLWYSEALYPLIFTVLALARVTGAPSQKSP